MENLHSQIQDESARTEEGIPQSNLVSGSLWMISVSLLLFFLPVFSGLVAGYLGGFKVGGTKDALVAAILPAMAQLCGLWALLTWWNLPDLGYRSDLIRAALCVLAAIAMLLGSAIGGTIAKSGLDPWNRA